MSTSCGSSTKRRRLVLSCSECKRRKLKCDRQTPICSRCVTMSHPELCKYDPRFFRGTDTSVNMEFTEDYSNIDFNALLSSTSENCQSIHALPLELGWDLERSSGDNDHHLTRAPSSDLDREETIDSFETQGRLETRRRQQSITQRSKTSRSQFKGPSHWMNVVTSFQGFQGFLRQTVQDHHILGASRWDTHQFSAEQSRPVHVQDVAEGVMKRLLPGEQRCLDLSKSYFDHFRGIHGILHVASFWEEYKIYWDGKHSDSACFNAILLALMSCSRCLFMDDPLSFNEDGSTARNEIVQWISAVEYWLDYYRDQKTSLEGFQVRCLVLYSKTINDIDSKDHYNDSQALLADAVSTGLHREGKVLGLNESVFERELRRKIWSAAVELSLACCLERGLPSMASNLTSDIGPPENFNDKEYDRITHLEPSKHPDVHFTDNSFARFACSTRSLRLNIIDLVNNPHRHESLDPTQREVLRQQITQGLTELPQWSTSTPESTDRSHTMICRAALEVSLHELLLLLHLPFIFRKGTETFPDTDYIRFVCIRSASIIIKTYELVANQGFSQMTLPRSNLLRAGLCVCLLETDTLNRGTN